MFVTTAYSTFLQVLPTSGRSRPSMLRTFSHVRVLLHMNLTLACYQVQQHHVPGRQYDCTWCEASCAQRCLTLTLARAAEVAQFDVPERRQQPAVRYPVLVHDVDESPFERQPLRRDIHPQDWESEEVEDLEPTQ